jgi:hypothetical protein
MGVLPVEFIIRDILAAEIEAVKNNPSSLDEILEGYTSFTIGGSPVVDYVQHYFSEVAIRAVIGWPRDNTLIPCIAIVIEDKREQHKFFGGFIGDEVLKETQDDPSVVGYQDEVGFISQASYRMVCLANTGDITAILGAIIETALMRNRLVLNEHGIMLNEIQVSDNIPMPEYLPVNIYNRSVTLTCHVATTAKVIFPTIKDVVVDLGTITDLNPIEIP